MKLRGDCEKTVYGTWLKAITGENNDTSPFLAGRKRPIRFYRCIYNPENKESGW
jgi:hypothetical protein